MQVWMANDKNIVVRKTPARRRVTLKPCVDFYLWISCQFAELFLMWGSKGRKDAVRLVNRTVQGRKGVIESRP